MLALHALAPLCATLGTSVRGTESMQELIDSWPRHYQDLMRLTASAAFADLRPRSISLGAFKIHAPVAPRQVFCTIANYRSGAVQAALDKEASDQASGTSGASVRARALALCEQRVQCGQPYIAAKPASAVIGPYDSVTLPAHAVRPDWEVELGVIMGRAARNISTAQAMDYVAGYTIVNDITVRELVVRDQPAGMGTDWIQAKGGAGFLPTGPFLVPAAAVADPYTLDLRLTLNGTTMQREHAGDMLFDIAAQLAYLSRHVQLLPGDLICTGSPAGFGLHYQRFLTAGDIVECTISGLGTQRNAIL